MRLTDDELSLLGEAWGGVNSDLKGEDCRKRWWGELTHIQGSRG